MHEHADTNATPSTGQGYDRTQDEADATTTDLYAPVPGDDDATRPGLVDDDRLRSARTTDHDQRNLIGRENETRASFPQQMSEPTPRGSSWYGQRQHGRTDGGIMQKIHDNPLAVVAAATAGGMLAGRLMRNRSQRRDEGYLRAASYRPPYQEPNFARYQNPAGYQGAQRWPGYSPSGEYYGGPQYRPEQEFAPGQAFQGRHENFPGGSHWA